MSDVKEIKGDFVEIHATCNRDAVGSTDSNDKPSVEVYAEVNTYPQRTKMTINARPITTQINEIIQELREGRTFALLATDLNLENATKELTVSHVLVGQWKLEVRGPRGEAPDTREEAPDTREGARGLRVVERERAVEEQERAVEERERAVEERERVVEERERAVEERERAKAAQAT